MPEAVLEGRALAMRRGDRLLFSDLDLAVFHGRALHVRGPNGSGKTSLLRILCGLLLPTEGGIWVRGRPVTAGDPELRGQVGYLGHSDGLKLELDALDNLAFAAALAGQHDLDLDSVLARVDLAAVARVATRRLSAGQRRRLAVARLLACNPPVWILDEPFTALDQSGMRMLDALLEDALDSGAALIFTSHLTTPLNPGRVEVVELGDGT